MQITREDQQWIDTTVASLSMRERLAQLMVPVLTQDGAGSQSIPDWVGTYQFGGGHIMRASQEATPRLVSQINAVAKVPLLFSGDLDRCGERLEGGTEFSGQMALGACDSEALAYALGKAIATVNGAVGFNWTFSPIVDLCAEPDHLRHIAAIGEDPEQVGRLAAAQIRGIQEHGMAACAKHFPGDGFDDRDQHLTTSINPLTEQQWFQKSGYAFTKAIEADVYTIMNSCIALPELDPGAGDPLHPRPAVLSQPLTEGLLRARLGFEGVIVTDALNMGGVASHAPQPERYALALEAGNDMLLFVKRIDSSLDFLVKCVASGRLSEARIEQSLRRVLALKAKLGLHKVAAQGTRQRPNLKTANFAGSAQELAEASLTLVRDRKQQLPLSSQGSLRIAHALFTNRADEFNAGVFEQTLQSAGHRVQSFVNPAGEPMYDAVASGQYDVVVTSLYYPVQWGWATTRCHGPNIRGMMAGYYLANPAVTPVFISFASPFVLYEFAFMDPFLVTYGGCAAAQRAAAQALLGNIPLRGTLPVSMHGFFQRGDGIQRK